MAQKSSPKKPVQKTKSKDVKTKSKETKQSKPAEKDRKVKILKERDSKPGKLSGFKLPEIKQKKTDTKKPAAPVKQEKQPTKTTKAVATESKPISKSKSKPEAKAPATAKAQPEKTPAPKNKDELNPVVLKKLIELGKKRGYVTYDELNTLLPGDEFSPEAMENAIGALTKADVNLVEEASEEQQAEQPAEDGEEKEQKEEENIGRSDDPVRMYLREMGNVELLSRDGEIEIAKRIEAGRETIITSLCESPLVMKEIMSWRDDLANGSLLLRDVIDLDATYGAGITADGEFTATELPSDIAAHKDEEVVYEGGDEEEEEEGDEEGKEGAKKEAAPEDDDDYPDASVSLVAMESALMPQVIDSLDEFSKVSKKMRDLQEKRLNKAFGSGAYTPEDEKKYQKLLRQLVDIGLRQVWAMHLQFIHGLFGF